MRCFALLSLGACLVGSAAWAVELAVGDLVVADAAGRILRIDPQSGAQEVIASGGFLGDPRAVAIAPDGMIWAADFSTGQLVEIDPSDGSQTAVFSGSIQSPRDIDFTLDGVLWVVGDGIWTVSRVPFVVVSQEEPSIDGIASGLAFAAAEDPANPGLAVALIAVGAQGVRGFDPDDVDPFYAPLDLPSPPDASVGGVDLIAGMFPVVTQSRLTQVFTCDAIGGVYLALGDAVAQIAAGSPFRCPRRLASTVSPDFGFDPPAGSFTLYVTDTDQSLSAPGPARVIEVTGSELSGATAETLAEGGQLAEPWDIEVVPETAGPAAALLAVLGTRAIRRRSR